VPLDARNLSAESQHGKVSLSDHHRSMPKVVEAAAWAESDSNKSIRGREISRIFIFDHSPNASNHKSKSPGWVWFLAMWCSLGVPDLEFDFDVLACDPDVMAGDVSRGRRAEYRSARDVEDGAVP
jgi:hypothetical protein